MILLTIDIFLTAFLIVIFKIATRNEHGFFSVLMPYAWIQYLLWFVPAILALCNVILLFGTSYSIWQALLPLVITITRAIYQYGKLSWSAWYWKTKIEPAQNEIVEYFHNKGYTDLHQIYINDSLKQMVIAFYKEDGMKFEKEEKELNEEFNQQFLKGRFKNYRAIIYTQTRISRHDS